MQKKKIHKENISSPWHQFLQIKKIYIYVIIYFRKPHSLIFFFKKALLRSIFWVILMSKVFCFLFVFFCFIFCSTWDIVCYYCCLLLSLMWLFCNTMKMCARCSRQEYYSRLPSPSPGDLLEPGIQSACAALAGAFFTTEPPQKPVKTWFSTYIILCMCVSGSVMSDSVILWTVALQALLPMEFSRQEYRSG